MRIIRDEEKTMTLVYNSSKEKSTLACDHHLTRDKSKDDSCFTLEIRLY